MPVQLLPASAAAYAPRASVNVVLGAKVEPWLTQTLKRVNKVKRPLNSVQQHQRCLTETLSSKNAIWTLASMMLTSAPDAVLDQHTDSFQFLHLEAYVVHVDMVLRNEVAFKLTTETIAALVKHHSDIYCPNTKASTAEWPDKEKQCKKLHQDFIDAVNKFVFRTHVSALEGLEEEGAGELLCGKSDEVKSSILSLMKPLVAPPPRVPEPILRQAPVLSSSPEVSPIWSQPIVPVSTLAPPIEAWRVLSMSPEASCASISDTSASPAWTNMSLEDLHVPSPLPHYAFPYVSSGFIYSSPPMHNPIPAPIPAIHYPNPFLSHCSIGSAGAFAGFGGLEWDRYPECGVIM